MRTCDLTLSGSSPTGFADGRLKFGRVIRIALIVCGSQVCVLWSCVGKSYIIARPDSLFTTIVAPKALQGCKESREVLRWGGSPP